MKQNRNDARTRQPAYHWTDRPDIGHVTSLPALAQALGISRSSARNLRRDGLPRNAQGYSIREAQELLQRRTLRIAHLQKSTTAEAAILAKTRKLEADASRSELELQIARGEVISRAVVSRQWRQAVIVVRDRFKNLGRELAPRLVSLGPQAIRAEIDRRVYEILRLLAHEKFAPANETESAHTHNQGDLI